ncbi:hypothetical protein [Bradyrhizobium sp. LHD-71]|uniref:hypothetical protein n=1 Tax=Bradyrhizobium sp. LHD-71 TaxID=3072141 RepID=UPI00280D21C0|nr:hypothetical protein [Bradyrhizobium sp. LHD-71]MDQ8732408.1 hypothetical protein [Bradyrhizobium sp. LHD-71]
MGKSFKLRYEGARFNGTRLPVDVLTDLPAFRDLLVAYAKDEWRALHADRQRVPKGFDKSISLDLIAIEDGSAIPNLDWDRSTAQAALPGFVDQLESIVDSSFGQLVALIDGAGHGQFPKSLGSEHIRALNKLGSGLRNSERIEFVGTKGADGGVVYLDSVRRKALITRVRETYQSRIESVGTLRGTQIDDVGVGGHILVSTSTYKEIKIPLEADRVKDEFDGNIESEVQFDLQVEMDNNDQLRSIVEVFDVGLIDAEIGAHVQRCRTRIEEIGRLEPGWHDGSGDKIAPAALENAFRFLSRRPSLSRTYKVYPTLEGGITFEFEVEGWDLTVEFLGSGGVELYGVEIEGNREIAPTPFIDLSADFLNEFDNRVKGQN